MYVSFVATGLALLVPFRMARHTRLQWSECSLKQAFMNKTKPRPIMVRRALAVGGVRSHHGASFLNVQATFPVRTRTNLPEVAPL